MHIGIDVDGVLTDIESFQLHYGKKFFEQKRGLPVKNPKGYDVGEIFACTSFQEKWFWIRYFHKYCVFLPIAQGAVETALKLHELGHRITIVTSRAKTADKNLVGMMARTALRRWLKKRGFHYDDIVFCSEDNTAAEKYAACKEKNIDLLVDDSPQNLLALRDIADILCFPAVWNEDCRELDAYRISEFSDILDHITCAEPTSL